MKRGSEEWKNNISLSLKGRKLSEESRRKISIALTGRKLSEETKRRMSESRKGKPHSIIHRINNSLSNRGAKSHLWKGGISDENERIRKTIEYRLWREAVFKRDKYTCIWCGNGNSDGERTSLNADHIKPFAFYPELRFAIDNGRTLCVGCHKKTPTFGRRKLFISN